MRKTIYIHVGYHKTATTFLQKSIYPKLAPQITYLSRGHIQPYLYKIRHKKLSDKAITDLRNDFESMMEEKKPLLISYEGLSGNPMSTKKKVKDNHTILKDLRRIFPEESYDVHIIVGVRRQLDLLTSLYVQYIHQGGYKKAAAVFEEWEQLGVLNGYYYFSYMERATQLFGKNNYYLMQYEQFRENEMKEITELLQYMGIKEVPSYSNTKVNRSYGTMQVKAARKMNYFLKTPFNPNAPVPTKRGRPLSRVMLQSRTSFKLHHQKYYLPESLQQVLQEKYQNDNQLFFHHYGIDYTKKEN
ncbi:Sulfotransferase domain-containing protein [Marinococcus luteus]|uniref:Sulfotransferase domain-containing protein n=1 Tax=Marinococcus luteus TaxID=1122204 RepID=A0A1H2XS93_9BACI|nr:sulfotransferase domain-containing protein [Marinococcus luteus]SDW95189.1 Sulfotransferase domain-containing protein [Marinococcus luteus]